MPTVSDGLIQVLFLCIYILLVYVCDKCVSRVVSVCVMFQSADVEPVESTINDESSRRERYQY